MSIIMLFVAPVQGGWRLEPNETRFSLAANLYPFWNGFIDVNEIVVRNTGEVICRDVVLTDGLRRPWLLAHAAKVRLGISSQGGIYVSEVHFDRPHLLVYIDSEEIHLPVTSGTGRLPITQLNMVGIKDGQLSVVAGSKELFVTNIDGSIIARSAGSYEIDLTRFVADRTSAGRFRAYLSVDTNEIAGKFLATHPIDINESAVFLDAFGMPVIRSFAGQATANMRADICFNDPNTYWPSGYVHLADAAVYTKYGRIVDHGNVTLRMDHNTFEFEPITARGLGGTLNGEFYIIGAPNKSKHFGGHFVVRGVSLEQLSAALGEGYLKQGRGSFAIDFVARSRQLNNFKARCAVYFDDADLWKVPVVSQLFAFLRLWPSQPLSFSDGLAEFRINGPVLTFKNARLTSKVNAIEFQPVATVNLSQHWVDAYAVTFPFGTSLAKVPVLGLFINFKNKLTRFHIKGDYTQKPESLIRKDVVSDIGKATLGFFSGAIKTRGNIKPDEFEDVMAVFEQQ